MPQLKSLHWLPVQARIDFKVATLAFRCVHGLAPSYLAELVSLQVNRDVVASVHRLTI